MDTTKELIDNTRRDGVQTITREQIGYDPSLDDSDTHVAYLMPDQRFKDNRDHCVYVCYQPWAADMDFYIVWGIYDWPGDCGDLGTTVLCTSERLPKEFEQLLDHAVEIMIEQGIPPTKNDIKTAYRQAPK